MSENAFQLQNKRFKKKLSEFADFFHAILFHDKFFLSQFNRKFECSKNGREVRNFIQVRKFHKVRPDAVHVLVDMIRSAYRYRLRFVTMIMMLITR